MYLTWLQEGLAVTWSPSTRSPSPAAWAVGVLEALPDYNDRSTDPDARRTDARTEDNGFLWLPSSPSFTFFRPRSSPSASMAPTPSTACCS